jgi:hypothetical protein
MNLVSNQSTPTLSDNTEQKSKLNLESRQPTNYTANHLDLESKKPTPKTDDLAMEETKPRGNTDSKKKKKGFAKLPEMAMPKGMNQWVNKIQQPMQQLQSLMSAEEGMEEIEEEASDKKFSMKLY